MSFEKDFDPKAYLKFYYGGEEIPFASAEQYVTIPVEEKVRKNDKVILA